MALDKVIDRARNREPLTTSFRNANFFVVSWFIRLYVYKPRSCACSSGLWVYYCCSCKVGFQSERLRSSGVATHCNHVHTPVVVESEHTVPVFGSTYREFGYYSSRLAGISEVESTPRVRFNVVTRNSRCDRAAMLKAYSRLRYTRSLGSFRVKSVDVAQECGRFSALDFSRTRRFCQNTEQGVSGKIWSREPAENVYYGRP